MKVTIVSSTAAILILCCYAIPCVTAAGIPDMLISANQDEGEIQPAGIVNDEMDVAEKLNMSHILDFTQEEIENNRLITIDWYGNERVSTDEEVIQTLELVHSDTSTFLYDEPHFTSDIAKRAIIGPDNRYQPNLQNAPYSAMGYLTIPGYRCSAYLVGPRHLITAAHCLHPPGNTGGFVPASQVTFYLRRNCYTTGVRYTVSEILVYSPYINSGNVHYDIAYLLLSATVYNWMGIAYRDPMPTVSGEVCGYPSDRGQCFYCAGCGDVKRIRTGWWGWSRSNTRVQYTCDMVGGMSGGPIITDDHDSTSNLYSYGVNTHETSSINYGVRISRNYFYDICRWKCNTGDTCSAVC